MKQTLLVALVLTACKGAPPPPDPRLALRDDARLVLERHCGQCHISSYPTALPGALRVYDLLDEEWPQHMNPVQLQDLAVRMNEPLGPSGEPLTVTDDERAIIGRFVDGELARMPRDR